MHQCVVLVKPPNVKLDIQKYVSKTYLCIIVLKKLTVSETDVYAPSAVAVAVTDIWFYI